MSCNNVADTNLGWGLFAMGMLFALVSPSISRLLFLLFSAFIRTPAVSHPVQVKLEWPLSLLICMGFIWLAWYSVPNLCTLPTLQNALFILFYLLTLIAAYIAIYRAFQTSFIVVPYMLRGIIRQMHIVDQGLRVVSFIIQVVCIIVFSILFLGACGANAALESFFTSINIFTWFIYIILVVPLIRDALGMLEVILDQPFDVGDEIAVHDQTGVVVAMGFFAVALRKADNTVCQVPMSTFVVHSVINYSRRVHRFISFSVPLRVNTTGLDNARLLIAHIQQNVESRVRDIDKLQMSLHVPSRIERRYDAEPGSFDPPGCDLHRPASLNVSFVVPATSQALENQIKTNVIIWVMECLEKDRGV